MILGALGRDAVGLGSSIEHPRESEEWKGMTLDEKYAFFAPIWRVMRSENLSVEQVKKQIEEVARAVKQGISPSDMRSHQFSGKLTNAQVPKINEGHLSHVALSRFCTSERMIEAPVFTLTMQNMEPSRTGCAGSICVKIWKLSTFLVITFLSSVNLPKT